MNSFDDILRQELKYFDKTKRLSQSEQEKVREILLLMYNLDNLTPDDIESIRQMSLKGYDITTNHPSH